MPQLMSPRHVLGRRKCSRIKIHIILGAIWPVRDGRNHSSSNAFEREPNLNLRSGSRFKGSLNRTWRSSSAFRARGPEPEPNRTFPALATRPSPAQSRMRLVQLLRNLSNLTPNLFPDFQRPTNLADCSLDLTSFSN